MGGHCEKGLAGGLFLVKLMEMNGIVRIRLWAQRTQNFNALWSRGSLDALNVSPRFTVLC